jgi:hypothetical protein
MHRIIECLKTPVGLKEVHAAIDDQDFAGALRCDAHTPIGNFVTIHDYHTRFPDGLNVTSGGQIFCSGSSWPC